MAWELSETGNADLPIELLSLGGDVNVGVLLLCSQCQLIRSGASEGMLCVCKVWSKLNSPRSLMLKTPLTVLLVLRCLILLSDGEAGVSSTAESTLLRGWVISMAADMVGWLE
jgi:hypothetical protein